jgi:RNA recognition motif-containing protein
MFLWSTSLSHYSHPCLRCMNSFRFLKSLLCCHHVQDQKTERNFGFVNFETAEAAGAAKEAMHDKEIEGRKLFVDRAQTKMERSDLLKRRYEQRRTALAQQWEGKNVYVKNLAAEVDEEMLKEAFKVWCSKGTEHVVAYLTS